MTCSWMSTSFQTEDASLTPASETHTHSEVQNVSHTHRLLIHTRLEWLSLWSVRLMSGAEGNGVGTGLGTSAAAGVLLSNRPAALFL